jgi:hypothetical protein
MANYSNDGRPQARALGIPLTGAPGEFNAITDVAGLEVGNSTIIRGEGPLAVGQGPVRTGVTAVLPRGRADVATPVFVGFYSPNGNGEMTGTHWLEEAGLIQGPICLMAQLMHPCRNTKIASPSGPSWSYPDFKGKPTQQKGGSDMLDLIVKSAKLVQDFGSTQPTGEISNQGY